MTLLTRPILTVMLIGGALTTMGAGCSPVKKMTTPTNEPSKTSSTAQSPNLSTSLVLDRSNSGIEKFPMDIVARTELTELNLSHNRMQGAMPAEIRHLKNLRTLNISNNRFTGLPAELGQLSNLEVLDVSYNQLTGLPYELGNLKNLQRLVLTGNNYSQQDLALILKAAAHIQVIR